ncbi:hypothetical protein [Shewanella xiamenensis]|uniref:hypothetical protein n=1 Tax=Shewanella xiamenensis TaxID=332186 RepID=UPI000AE778F9|nr:hypothetical protein [Shewanella xiamenensis]
MHCLLFNNKSLFRLCEESGTPEWTDLVEFIEPAGETVPVSCRYDESNATAIVN